PAPTTQPATHFTLRRTPQRRPPRTLTPSPPTPARTTTTTTDDDDDDDTPPRAVTALSRLICFNLYDLRNYARWDCPKCSLDHPQGVPYEMARCRDRWWCDEWKARSSSGFA